MTKYLEPNKRNNSQKLIHSPIPLTSIIQLPAEKHPENRALGGGGASRGASQQERPHHCHFREGRCILCTTGSPLFHRRIPTAPSQPYYNLDDNTGVGFYTCYHHNYQDHHFAIKVTFPSAMTFLPSRVESKNTWGALYSFSFFQRLGILLLKPSRLKNINK